MMAIRYENKTLIFVLNTTVDILFTFIVTFLCVSYGHTTTFTPTFNGNNINELPNLDFSSNGCSVIHLCNSSVPFPARRCQCDSLCDVMKDCCNDVEQASLLTLHDTPKPSQFQCTNVNIDIKTRWLLLVAKCASSWKDKIIRSLCEDIADKDDFLVEVPVTATDDNLVTYRNRYCAYCNQQYSFVSWNYTLQCFTPPTQDFSNCVTSLTAPVGVDTRICLPEVVSTCLPDHENKDNVHECIFGNYSHVGLQSKVMYFRNLYCALCNGILFEDITCLPLNPRTGVHNRGYSFRCLVDINKATTSCTGDTDTRGSNCKDTEMYDLRSMTCRPIICPHGMESVHAACMKADNISGLGHDLGLGLGARNCTWSKLEAEEFFINENNTLVVHTTGTKYNRSEFKSNGTDVFVCVNNDDLCFENCGVNELSFNKAEGLLSTVGLSVSIFALVITMSIYIIFKKLRNIPGKILVCLLLTLMIGQLSFLISPFLKPFGVWCQLIAIVTHACFLSAFCWTNVMV